MESGRPRGTQYDVGVAERTQAGPESANLPRRTARSACGKARPSMIRPMTTSLLPNRAAWLALVACLGAAAAAKAEDPRRIDPLQPAGTARYPDAAEVARGSRISEAE